MKTIYKGYAIYSDAISNNKGMFDTRIVLQKIWTTHITSHYSFCPSLIKSDSESQGTSAGKEMVDIFLQKMEC